MKTADECLILDSDKVGAIHEVYDSRGGGYIDDGEVLREQWSPGMGVKKIAYCLEDEEFVSL